MRGRRRLGAQRRAALGADIGEVSEVNQAAGMGQGADCRLSATLSCGDSESCRHDILELAKRKRGFRFAGFINCLGSLGSVGPRQSVETKRVGSPQASGLELRGAFSPAKTRLLSPCASHFHVSDPVTRVFWYPNVASKRQNRLKLPIILIQINKLAWSDPFDSVPSTAVL